MWRPKKPNQFIGKSQRKYAKWLMESKPQFALFVGDSGTGKTSLAKFYIEEVLGVENYHHINCDGYGVNEIRNQIIPTFNLRPFGEEYVVWLFDELQHWGKKQQGSLLVALEQDLPEHVIVMGASSQPEQVDSQLSSRLGDCKRLWTPSVQEQAKLIKALANPLQVDLTKDDIKNIIETSMGNMRSLVNNLFLFKDGGFVPFSDSYEENDDFLQALRNGNPYAVPVGSNYIGIVKGICSYALGILENKPDDEFANNLIQTFGEPLQPDITGDYKFCFYRRVAEFYETRH